MASYPPEMAVSGESSHAVTELIVKATRVNLEDLLQKTTAEAHLPILARQAPLIIEASRTGDRDNGRYYQRILFVDDDHPTVVMLGDMVTRLGLDYIGVGGRQAPEQAYAYCSHTDTLASVKRQSTLLLIDYAMPTNGLDLLAALRQDALYPSIHAAIMTYYPLGSMKRDDPADVMNERLRRLRVEAWAKQGLSAHPREMIKQIHDWHMRGRGPRLVAGEDPKRVLRQY